MVFNIIHHFLSWIILYIYLNTLFIFRERGKEGGREGGKHWFVVAFCMPPTGDLAGNPGMCPDWELNQWPFGSQAGTPSIEPHQLGLYSFFKKILFRERGTEGGREGENYWCEWEILTGCLLYTHRPGTEPVTQLCTLTRNWTGNFRFVGWCPKKWATPVRTILYFWYDIISWVFFPNTLSIPTISPVILYLGVNLMKDI